MPLVVHTGGNTVYEEPCLAIIHMHITKVSSSSLLPRPNIDNYVEAHQLLHHAKWYYLYLGPLSCVQCMHKGSFAAGRQGVLRHWLDLCLGAM